MSITQQGVGLGGRHFESASEPVSSESASEPVSPRGAVGASLAYACCGLAMLTSSGDADSDRRAEPGLDDRCTDTWC